MSTKYNRYQEKLAEIADLSSAISILHWDLEVNAPENSGNLRSRQLATLTGLHHQMACAEDLGGMLEDLSVDDSLSELEKRNIEESLDDYSKRKKYSREFVEKLSVAQSKAFASWIEARKKNDYKIFQSDLDKIVVLKKQEAEILGYEAHPYDALMNEYEKGAKTADIKNLFAGVREQLVEFVQRIANRPQIEDGFLYGNYGKDAQWNFGLKVLERMGYDFKTGRQDISAHPFTVSFGPSDVRVTTRVDETNFKDMLWSCIHEGGHALYEQGLPEKQYGLPACESTSLGIHESQSRLWENNVGRNKHVWNAWYKEVQETFPLLKDVSEEAFYKAINKVEPSLIRTDADELTYHFHVMIRFELELALIEGELKVADLPAAWNAKYKEYLGIDVPSDDQGVLQDVHWSHGSFGYFPTYSLGSFYAAQFYRQANKDIVDLESQLKTGNCTELLSWLRTNIHQHGRIYSSDELCKRITGESLKFDYFMEYAENKYADIYGI